MVERERPEALLVDSWLPDLEAGELTGQLGTACIRDGPAADGWWDGVRA